MIRRRGVCVISTAWRLSTLLKVRLKVGSQKPLILFNLSNLSNLSDFKTHIHARKNSHTHIVKFMYEK
jgi:hypothetical protein